MVVGIRASLVTGAVGYITPFTEEFRRELLAVWIEHMKVSSRRDSKTVLF